MIGAILIMNLLISNKVQQYLSTSKKEIFFNQLIEKIIYELKLGDCVIEFDMSSNSINQNGIGVQSRVAQCIGIPNGFKITLFSDWYVDSFKQINIFNELNDRQLAFIIAHEMRHGYQNVNKILYAGIDLKIYFHKFLFQIYDNKLNLINFNEIDFNDYIQFPWEIDANEYAFGFLERNSFSNFNPDPNLKKVMDKVYDSMFESKLPKREFNDVNEFTNSNSINKLLLTQILHNEFIGLIKPLYEETGVCIDRKELSTIIFNYIKNMK